MLTKSISKAQNKLFKLNSLKLCLAMIFLITLPNSFNAKCAEGCLKCKGENVCEVCDAASLYVLSEGECLKQDLEFCLLTFNLFSCIQCYPGFYIELNGKCVRNPEGVNEIKNCLVYDSYTRCKTCKQYYFLGEDGKTCERITTEPITNCTVYEKDKKCLTCGDFILSTDGSRCDVPEFPDRKCMFYSNKTSCKKCKDNYYLDKNYYIRHISTYYQYLTTKFKQYYISQESTVNIPVCEAKTIIKNCLIPKGNHKCAQCKPGYYINESYNLCIEDPPKAQIFLAEDISNCFVYNKTMVTRNNVEVLNIECRICYEGYYKAVNNRKCQKHTKKVNFCKVMSQSKDSECILCESEYYRKDQGDEKCIKRVDVDSNCKKYNPLSEACETCKDESYIKHYGDKKCSPKIQNCRIYETSGETLSCKQCDFGYYFVPANATCIENDTFDPYCAFYNEAKQCQECSFGFFYDTSQSTPKCEPNTPEYVFKAQCKSFHALNKNDCIGCDGGSTIIKLQYTCKGFNTNVTSNNDAKSFITYCNKYEMTISGSFKCYEPLPEVLNDNEDYKKVYVLIEDLEKAEDWTNKKIAYCNKHKTVYKTSSDQILCEECYAERHILTHYDFPDMSDTKNCKDSEVDSGYCVRYFSEYNTCRTYTYYNINYDNCPYYWTCCPSNEQKCAYKWHHNNGEYTTNNCNVPWYVRSYWCYSMDGPNCMVYHFFRFKTVGVRFSENIKYEIVIAPDKTQCLSYDERRIENDSGCVMKSDNGEQCLLCKKNFYSIPYKVFPYELDAVESYVSRMNSADFVEGCIKFSNVSKSCSQCEPGYYIDRSSCVNCQANNMAIDSTEKKCLQFVDSNFPNNVCKRISVGASSTSCIECKSGYAADWEWDPTIKMNMSFYPIIDSVKTMIELQSEHSKIKECKDTTDLFYYKPEYKDTLNNCLFYQMYNDVMYCMGCKFGYVGEVYETPNNFLTVQNCVKDESLCDLSVSYPLKDPFISSLVTCHQCKDTSKIPTFTFFYMTAKNVSKIEFIYKHSSLKTMLCENPTISNCMIQFTTQDSSLQSKWGGRSTVCLYCKPKYTPTYSSTTDDFFPYQYITSCNQINYCEKSLIPNKCQECQTNSTPDQNRHNLKTSGEVTSCEDHNYIATNPFCKTTQALTSSSSGTCVECKDGYVSLNSKCVKLNVTTCKYYQGATCVESTKELKKMKSIIWREFNSDYTVNTINCIEVDSQKEINKCVYYLSEDVCHQCETGYYLTDDGKTCYQRNTDQCIEYDNQTMKCTKCASDFDLTGSSTCTTSSKLNKARGCLQYRDSFCSKCTSDSFHPIKINLNKTSICINSFVSNFCEEIDEDKLFNEKKLSCKTCKKIDDFQNIDPDFDLTNYDFYDKNTETYAESNLITKASKIYDHYKPVQDYFINQSGKETPTFKLRFALFKYDYNICQKYVEIENCLVYDDSTFEKTFDCKECKSGYFLNGKECSVRTIFPFCVQYYIDKNECERFSDSSDYSINLSTFDQFVIDNQPDAPVVENNTSKGIEGCVSYFDSGMCKYCNSTTYIYDNLCLTVETIVPNCQVYSRDGFCIECKEGLILFQNKCLTNYAQNCAQALSNTSCKLCPIENPFLSSGSCIKNPAVSECDSYASLNTCFKCGDNFHRNQSGLCELTGNYIPNCKKHMSGPFCSECQENYALINNQCIANPNYDRNCLEFDATSECNICAFNHYFKDDQCYECLTDSFSCYFCDPDNPDKCLLCRSGFFMNNEFECVVVADYTQPLIRLNQESRVSESVSRFGLSTVMISLLLLLLLKPQLIS